MSNKYETGYGVKFSTEKPKVDPTTGKLSYKYSHSYRSYGLFPKSKMIVQPPDVRETYIDIAGMDGELDLSEVLTGYPSYEGRDAKFEFTVMNRIQWDHVYSRLMNEIHGRRLYVVIDEDGNYHYIGRLKVDSFKSKKNTATIVVDGYLDPYKVSHIATSEWWLWDPFNFETDIARDYAGLTVDGSATYTIVGSRMPVNPTFKASASGMTVSIDGSEPFDLPTGDYDALEGFPAIREGEYEMTFSGSGTVNIKFEIGSL